MLSLQDITISIAGNQILSDVNLQISGRQHVGLVGRNGSGKSTLFKVIQHQLEADSGSVFIERNCRIISVKQELPDGELTPREFILSQDQIRSDLMAKLEKCAENSEDLCDIYDKLFQINAFEAESRAAVILSGLGFSEEEQNKKLKEFSGGFRMRVALGAALYADADILLLDEPTNHLDLETSHWLKSFLKKYPKSFIIISHERDFLNETVDYIAHIKNKHLTKYTGNFDTFLNIYTNAQKNAEAYNKKMETQQKHMMDFVKRFHAKATKAKQAQSRLKAISKIKFLPIENDDPTTKFNFPDVTEIPSPIISYNKISLGYENKTVLRNLSGSIMNDDRIAIVGANGNGKTTFAKFIAGELSPQKGTVNYHKKLKIGFYKQDVFETLNENETPFIYIKSIKSELSENAVRTHLGGFGLPGDMAYRKIGELSGGERARLVFAGLTVDAPNLLILDEPTNHLDLEMRESLIYTLTNYKSAVILITHDSNFLNRVANSIFVVDDGKVTQFNDDLAKYEKYIKIA